MRHLFVAAAAAGFSLSAVMGLFLALVPTLIQTVLGVSGPAASGEVVAFLFTASAGAEFVLRRWPTRVAISAGLAALIAGLAVIVASELADSVALFLLGTFLAGVGQGLALTGVLAAVNLASPPDRRSQVISSLYVFNYLGSAVPVLGAGAAISAVGLTGATAGFAIVIGAVSGFALWLIQRVDPARHPDAPSHHALAGCPRLG
jgi:fucose permease